MRIRIALAVWITVLVFQLFDVICSADVIISENDEGESGGRHRQGEEIDIYETPNDMAPIVGSEEKDKKKIDEDMDDMIETTHDEGKENGMGQESGGSISKITTEENDSAEEEKNDVSNEDEDSLENSESEQKTDDDAEEASQTNPSQTLSSQEVEGEEKIKEAVVSEQASGSIDDIEITEGTEKPDASDQPTIQDDIDKDPVGSGKGSGEDEERIILNYASTSAGAIVLEKSPNSKGMR